MTSIAGTTDHAVAVYSCFLQIVACKVLGRMAAFFALNLQVTYKMPLIGLRAQLNEMIVMLVLNNLCSGFGFVVIIPPPFFPLPRKLKRRMTDY